MTGNLDRGAAAGCLLLFLMWSVCVGLLALVYCLFKFDWQLAMLLALTLSYVLLRSSWVGD